MRRLFFSLILISILLVMPIHALAHPGRTDSSGGHRNRSTGEYHYHHGYSAHQHEDLDGDGKKDCPYDFKDNTDHNKDISNNTKNMGQDTNGTRNQTTTSIGSIIENLFELFFLIGFGMMVLSTFILLFLNDTLGGYYISIAFGFIKLAMIFLLLHFLILCFHN